jgi:hypothetical protein
MQQSNPRAIRIPACETGDCAKDEVLGLESSLQLDPGAEVLVSKGTPQSGSTRSDGIGRIETSIRFPQTFLFEAEIQELIAELRQKEAVRGFRAEKILVGEGETNRTKGMMADNSPARTISRLNNPTIGRAPWCLVPKPAHLVQLPRR